MEKHVRRPPFSAENKRNKMSESEDSSPREKDFQRQDGCEEGIKDEGSTLEDRFKVREKLSGMTFEDLQKLKTEIGTKMYNRTIFGDNKNKSKKAILKRANKNRPREVSSKRKFKLETNVTSVEKQKHIPRDPRFDPLCGTFDKKTFESNYKFVGDIRNKEKCSLEKQLQETTDPAEKRKLQHVLQRINNQIREKEKRERATQKELEEKNAVREKLKSGEKPRFKKKSVKKIENLINKYEELKKTNLLQKHIERRSKKLSSKERRNLERENVNF